MGLGLGLDAAGVAAKMLRDSPPAVRGRRRACVRVRVRVRVGARARARAGARVRPPAGAKGLQSETGGGCNVPVAFFQGSHLTASPIVLLTSRGPNLIVLLTL